MTITPTSTEVPTVDEQTETKYPGFIVREQTPLNGGPDPARLRRDFITANDAFYVRAHAPAPRIDPSEFRLSVGGQVAQALSLSLAALQHDFPAYTLTATLQCAGNRRTELAQVAPMPGESVMWETDAISTAEWTGARLADVLALAGVDAAQAGLHVEFISLDRCVKDGQVFGFGGSIPLDKALTPEVLLVYGMNGAPLPMTHGYPLRVVVPGYIAARSVKWLGQIIVRDTPSDNYYQQRDYKLFPPEVTAQNADWTTGEMLGEMATDAVICIPAAGTALPAGPVRVEGYAIAGGNAQIIGVQLSADDGMTWQDACLLGEARPFTWRFWQADLTLSPGTHTLIVRAQDSAGSAQPETAAAVWNFKGYMNNSLHRVTLHIRPR